MSQIECKIHRRSTMGTDRRLARIHTSCAVTRGLENIVGPAAVVSILLLLLRLVKPAGVLLARMVVPGDLESKRGRRKRKAVVMVKTL